ncbi:restriction endonuclease subunit S [Agathobaculum sp. NSJ-28]|uniref:Restriction endonuclease subunit S n=1 Tax=Agathobaculum faecis TaxID=2763013 RepID=A0A923RY73_9FIRM|nr:restriction endonuclease subunit S [Ruminococcus bromii]MBC5725070.1 restriction endonuclease subunit S [Agathobaculum faecis]MEE0007108.1 restriction endonuclease subunit S [Ruminococcus bromii]
MKFLDVFNEIEKGNYALTDEAIYASLQNGDELIPLYGGNKEHATTERRISISAKTKKGVPITVFSGEGIIISLDGSAGSMTYKSDEKFALNHHAGFITLRKNARDKVNLEYFSIFLQNFYREMGVSDGSKTLSLTQIYAEEFDLPKFEVQNNILHLLKGIKAKLENLATLKNNYKCLIDKEISVEYTKYQGKNIDISTCIDYMSGNTGLTEEFIYQTLQNGAEHYQILSSATEDSTMMGEIPMCVINNRQLKVFEGQEGLLVTRNGKAGYTKYLNKGRYTINDHAYILFVKDDSPYKIDLRWLAIQYKQDFLSYASNSDNGTWNMTGFFSYTKIDIPCYDEQLSLVKKHQLLQNRIAAIEQIEEQYSCLISKEIA